MFKNRSSRIAIYGLASLSGLLFLCLVIFSTTHRPFRIPTGAMMPTLQIGDHLYARLVGDDFQPRVGDILIFKNPENHEVEYVKRCVALAGDSVEVREGILYVNGVIYESNFAEPEGDHSCIPVWDSEGNCPTPCSKRDQAAFLRNKRNRSWPWAGMPTPYTVPEGRVFMMGDNRYNSLDSRYWGALDMDLIIGKASFFYWSSEDPGRIGTKVR